MYRRYYTPGDFKRSPIDDSSVEETEGEKEEEVKEVNAVEEIEEGEEDIKPALASLPIFEYQTFDAASLTFELQTSSRAELKRFFICRKARVRQESISIPPPRPNLAPDEDYTDVFLSHAQLYFFAEKYDIQVLRMLALETLQNTLAIFTLHKERTGDIIALLRYVYANTNELHDGIEDLRSLLTQYVGYEMDTLILDKEFRNLMIDDGGALLGDFMEMVLKRIV